MFIRKAYKFRLEPNAEHRQKMAMNAGCCRFVWNKALALQKESLENTKKFHKYTELAAFLKSWKQEEETVFLKDADSQALQQTLKHLDRAFKNCFNKKLQAQFPVFKKKGVHDSFLYPQRFKFDGNKIYLPKVGWVKYRNSQEVFGTPKNVTVSKNGNHWFFSVQVELEIEAPKHPSRSEIGVDLGISKFVALSNGQFIEPLNSFKKNQKRLAKAQKDLARKQKFSNNWKKQKSKIIRIHSQIANARNDFLHKESTRLTKNHGMIVVEDLKVNNMSKSAKGNIEEPGRNVKAKSGLNKSILDQGWGNFRRMLEYKQSWLGGTFVKVDPKNTSRRCFICGHTEKGNRTKQELFKCLKCCHTENADTNAAKNILAVGYTVLACGDTKQIAA
jgi:putative transposase